MKKIIAGSLFMLLSAMLRAQTEDVVLMRIGEQDVLRSEFEYAYNKNKAQSKMLLTDFIQSFIHLKLQALEAANRGLDTSASFREEMRKLTLRLNRPLPDYLSLASTDGRPHPRVAHLFIYLPQNASSRTIRTACDRMDSIYRTVLSSGQPFEECVQTYIDQPFDGIYGELTILPAHHTMEEVERKTRSLQAGELSRPFVSPAGVHLIEVLGRDGADETGETVGTELIGADAEQAYLLAEWREMLLSDALNRETEAESIRPEQLASYFKKHKKKYAWELPRYKGCVLYCKDKSIAKEVKDRLKRLPVEQWPQAVEHYNAKHPGNPVKAECGLFRIGTNPAVDKVVFKQGAFLPSSDYPYVIGVGKKLKKGPDSYVDVYQQVKKDYKTSKRAEEVGGWLKKYKVEINQEVLKTVNNH